jgi:hypothetical protein
MAQMSVGKPADRVVERIRVRMETMYRRSELKIPEHVIRNTLVEASDSSLEWHIDQGIRIHFTTAMVGQKLETPTLTVQYPETWWEHFKQRWLPKWALKRWPVKYKVITETYEVMACYTDLAFNVTEHPHYIVISKVT